MVFKVRINTQRIHVAVSINWGSFLWGSLVGVGRDSRPVVVHVKKPDNMVSRASHACSPYCCCGEGGGAGGEG